MLAKPVVYLILIVASAIALSFGCSDSDSDARGGPTVEVVGDEIIIPQAALAPLSDGYAFSSDLDIDGLEQDLRVRFDGVQVDASTQGEAVVEGSYGVVTGEEQAAEMQIVVVGERSWWRLDDEDWEIGNEPGGDSVHPSLTLAHYATPWFYLDALRFDSLTLPMQGSAEDVNGATAYPVRLDKQAVVDVLQQGTEYKRYPDVWDEHAPLFPGLSENTEQVLPADFLVDVWFAEQGGYPLRIAFTYSVGEDDFCNLCWGFDRGVTVSLQMDITDPDAEVDIEPPIPIPTETNLKPPPGATIPSLTADDEARILDIV